MDDYCILYAAGTLPQVVYELTALNPQSALAASSLTINESACLLWFSLPSGAMPPRCDTAITYLYVSTDLNALKAKSFRVSCDRKGNHDFDSMDVQQEVGARLRTMYPHVPVSLEHYDIEILVIIRGDVRVEGVPRPSAWTAVKGSVSTKCAEHVAAYLGLRLAMPMRPHCSTSSPPVVRLLDPMCGVASLARGILEIFSRSNISCTMACSDLDEPSLEMALVNLAPQIAEGRVIVQLASTNELPHADESFDIIVTDPPWGHRHMKSSQLNKQYHAWIREWSRVLKPGGLLVISTITSRIVEDKMNVAKKFELVEKSRFDNMGFTVCTCFIYRKAHA